MIYLSLIRYKLFYVLMFLVIVGLIYKDVMNIFFFFDTTAPDLVGKGVEIKNEYLISGLNLINALFDLGFFVSFCMPIIIAILGYDYYAIKGKYIQKSIGKTNDYIKRIRHLKLTLAWIPTVLYSLLFLTINIIAQFSASVDIGNFKAQFIQNSLLGNLISTQNRYLILYGVVVSIAIYFNALLLFKIIDVTHNFVRGALCYIALIWLGSLILYRLLPHYLMPMTTFMNMSYGKLTVLKLLLPYLPMLGLYAWLDRYAKDV